ncbi:MAG: Trk system potassium transporter TrkA, partial [Lachnospiraceae bacterium]|nr:Trk system potassium transporter TrkA [Lachnospiraceae bacterium]
MRIVIIGDGKIGFQLASQLSAEDYDIVLIDSNEKKLRTAIDKLDIFCVAGDGASAEVQKEAGVPQADLVIACASTDEFNMLTCLIARSLGAKHTIARVRNPVYHKQIDLIKNDLHLSMVINPELIVAQEINRLLIFPDASKVETFVKGKVELLELPLGPGNPLVGLSLKDMYIKYQIKLLVCAVERGDEVLIPDGDFVMQEGDHLHITATHRELERFFKLLKRKQKIRKVLICGGGKLSYYLAKRLLGIGMQVKIIEIKEDKCESLCELLPKATVIHGDATNHDLLLEEGLEEADALVSLMRMDEENIIVSLFAHKLGVPKVVLKVNDERRVGMFNDEFGLDCIVSAKSVTADAVVSYVRARHNS